MSAEFKNLFQLALAFVLGYTLKDMNFMEAIEYGLSNLISSLWKKDREKQWKAIYATNTCLFNYGRDLSSCVIRIVWEN